MSIIEQSVLDRVRQPVERALGLPNDCYTDAAYFEWEKKAVFFANWAAIGFGKDIPKAGDAMPVDFLGMPLLAVRDQDGKINVFQNTCRHRGMILLEEKANLRGVIRCPYHSWCYDLNGDLRMTPHVGGPGNNVHCEIKKPDLGLWDIRSFVWRDVIFVNVSGDAPSFEKHASELMKRWKEFEQPVYHAGEDSYFELNIQTNWKLAVENYCESYHLPWVHPGLNSYSKLSDHYHIEEPGRFSGQGTLVYSPMMDESGTRFREFAGLGDKWDRAGEYIAFFPNVLFGVHRDHAFAIILEPVSVDRTVEHISLYYASDEMCGDDWGEMRQKNSEMWKEVFVEDIFVVEGMQKGRHGPMFDGGKFSPAMDSPTHVFHHWVADQLRDGG
ncbi:MAG: aromatic ring-hydroxylating dioxygenase subunit alpha [Pseudomonadota bacterium]